MDPHINATNSNTPVLGTTEKWEKEKLSPKQARMWNETRTAILWAQPAFSDIWYSMMTDDQGQTAWFTSKLPSVAATDDRYMYINPEPFFDKYTLGNRVFIGCHEIIHAMLGHCAQLYNISKKGHIDYADGTRLPFDNDQFQRSMDCVINAMLVEGKVGDKPDDACLDQRVPATMSVLDAYRVIYKKKPGQGKGDGKGQAGGAGSTPGSNPGNFDQHLKPGGGTGQDANEAMSDRNETEWKTAVAAALASAKLQGRLPAGLERLLGAVLEPEVDWVDLIRSALTRKLGMGGGSWEQLDASMLVRGIGSPGRVGFGAGRIIVAVDTSGSITQDMMDRFMSEVGGILDDVRPRELVLVQCDAAIHEWVECDDTADLQRKILGGGGTDFRPVFERIEQEGCEPDALIYFTDGYGSFPAKVPYPVIWGNITKGYEKHYPFGEVVFVPLKKGDTNS